MHSDVWRNIRALRAVPVGEAAKDLDRAATFRAALRQAEELADAAQAAGYASSALPLFYSLEQAAQAIEVAHAPAGARAARGHGLKFVPNGASSVLGAAITPSGYGAFQAICAATGSPTLAGTTPLGALWAANPDLRSLPIPTAFGTWQRPIDQMIGVRAQLDEYGNVHDPEKIPLTTSGLIEFSVDLPATTVGEVEAALQGFPTLRQARGVIQGTMGPIFGEPEDQVLRGAYGTSNVRRATVGVPAPKQMTVAEYQRRQNELFSVIEVDSTYPLHPYPHLIGFALPCLGGGLAPLPLQLWWMLLLGLSSLVRYHPALWVKAIDRDFSELAVHLEAVLDLAVQRVPERLLEALSP